MKTEATRTRSWGRRGPTKGYENYEERIYQKIERTERDNSNTWNAEADLIFFFNAKL